MRISDWSSDVCSSDLASEQKREERRFNRYDKDRDEAITREEYLASRRKAFAKPDVNGDGRLSFEEWAIRTTDKVAKADADGSIAVTRAEFATTALQGKYPAKPECAPVAGAAGDEENERGSGG